MLLLAEQAALCLLSSELVLAVLSSVQLLQWLLVETGAVHE